MLRSAKINYDNGQSITTSLAAGLTDREILDYFKVGATVNIGDGEYDKLVKIVKVEILS
jgi:hypothetical protein